MTLRNAATPHHISVRFFDDDEHDDTCHSINVISTDDVESVWRTAEYPTEHDSSDAMSEGDGRASGEDVTRDESVVIQDTETLQPVVPSGDTNAASPLSSDASGIDVADEDSAGTQTNRSENSALPPRPTGDMAAGPVIAELVATRAELRRVEGELKKAMQERNQLAGLKDAHTRLQSDFDNFRKRARAEAHQALAAEVVSRLLPVADNFRRAVEVETNRSEDLQQFVIGVELIRGQLDEVLETYGVEAIATVGEMFDPHIHEAIATEATADLPPNIIVAEIVRGYRLGDKLLRPALVKVAVTP